MVNKKRDPSVTAALNAGLTSSPFYPLSFVKVLIQVGHEPLPPFKSRSLFGREQYFYPNSFSYLKYIYSVEGLTGLYRGLGMKVISHSVATYVYDNVAKMLEENDENSENKEKTEDSLTFFVRTTSNEITAKCLAVVISHPFHVMALRCMAQFIGGETNYSSWNIFYNASEIFRSEGILGFFSGLVPRLLFEASTIAIANTIAYFMKSYLVEDKAIDAAIDLLASLLANSVTYPLSVVSTVSCISGSSLVAGRPPRMPVYASWIEVFKHLYENNELKRGSSSFFRVYTPPVLLRPTGFTLGQASAIKALKQ